jgi:hypothetical protein
MSASACNCSSLNSLKYGAPPKMTKGARWKRQLKAPIAHPTRLKNAASKETLLLTGLNKP